MGCLAFKVKRKQSVIQQLEGKKICFAVAGTADEDTRHEGEAFVTAWVELGIWVNS